MVGTRVFCAAASILAVCAFSSSSYATSLSFSETTSLPPGVVTAPNGGTSGNFVLSTEGSITNSQLSPFGDSTTKYSVLGGAGSPFGTATFDYASGISTWSFIWGSPDLHNELIFTGPGGFTETVNGSVLGVPIGSGAYLVTVTATGGLIDSVELLNGVQAAFEYDNVTPTPLPAALPLFASALGVGFFATWRKKRKAKSQAALA
jgi:hypothetical protein